MKKLSVVLLMFAIQGCASPPGTVYKAGKWDHLDDEVAKIEQNGKEAREQTKPVTCYRNTKDQVICY